MNPGGASFPLRPGESRDILMQLEHGAEFTAEDVTASAGRTIHLFGYADDILVGGMSYELDPNLKAHGPIEPHHNGECGKRAAQMLECVRLGHEKVRAVRVRKVNVDIGFEDDECLD